MASTNDLSQRHQQIQLLFADDNISEAIKRLMDFVRDFSRDNADDLNEVIVISASYNRLNKAERRGTTGFDEIELRRNKLLYQALALMDGVIA
ncbi:MAG: hypothetical protein DIZ78_08020 [endosymbiont of Escarpia spicata]|uniref:Effector-associated domain-containing protein n=1 Tax=endosymbiont of Escarpia spicata TaxID=2200908 RepID=A0A370DPJ2_9GAMM|nr:hypothetical protein [gamma proteobacterium endosymbiont of Lamellibrachia anaximandri]MBL3619382.1 hypothetical protein [gamma proteobacterium endosymbiont of Lamellibrachia anaximandri]RDH86826.1 MAG: hypothetical protein DIZ78_08020 [endosymbiont of Escarpia spicata]